MAKMVAMTPALVKPLIRTTIPKQLDIRVGSIKSVQDVPGADKLVQLRVNFGDRPHPHDCGKP
jgi:tRNA-binding EMAP/Myf-like protein